MGWAILSAPGTEFGPCMGNCGHTDCEATRLIAKSGCRYCHQPIGYKDRFYQIDEYGKSYAHAHCAEKEAQRIQTAVREAEAVRKALGE